MSSFFKGKVRWWDGLYLSPEHLKEENKYLENAARNVRHILNNYEHVCTLKINEILLTRGILEVMEFQGVFSNLEYVEYDMNSPTEILNNGDKSGHIYEIREDLNKFSKIILEKGLLFYLCIDEQEQTVVDCIATNNDTVTVEKTVPMLILVPEHLLKNTYASLPIIKIISDKGGFIIDENYEAPVTKLSKENHTYILLEKFIKFLRNHVVEIAAGFFTKKENNTVNSLIEKLNYSLQYNSIMPEILVLESLLDNQAHPLFMFLSLQKIIGSLSLLRFTNLPSVQTYKHQDIYNSISNLVAIITDMINNLKVDGERIQMSYKEEKFNLLLPIESFVPTNKNYLLIEMDSENQKDSIINWIEDARICGADFDTIVTTKRVRGIERKIINTPLFGNKILVIELNFNSEYLAPSKPLLYVYNAYNEVIPKSIIFCWRNDEF